MKIDLPCEDIGEDKGQTVFFIGLLDGVKEGGFYFPSHLSQMPIQDDLPFRCDISISFPRDFIDIGLTCLVEKGLQFTTVIEGKSEGVTRVAILKVQEGA